MHLSQDDALAIVIDACKAGAAAASSVTVLACGWSVIISYDLILAETEFADQLRAIQSDLSAGRYAGRDLPFGDIGVGSHNAEGYAKFASAQLSVGCPARPSYWCMYGAEAFDRAFVNVLERHGIMGWLVGTRLD